MWGSCTDFFQSTNECYCYATIVHYGCPCMQYSPDNCLDLDTELYKESI